MSRYDTAKTARWSERVRAWACAICVALASPVVCAVGAAGDVKDQTCNLSGGQPRAVTVLDKQAWRFIQDDNLTDAAALSSDASTWSTVHLPHTWNAIDAATSEQTTPTSQSYKRGKGWYRLEFDRPCTAATQWVQFDGASIVADVWLNGEKLGQHKGAFTAFRFDVTGKLLAGQKNVLLVKTDNTAPVTSTDLTAIAPLSGDFNMSGGLYRGVSLISTRDAAHIALDDFGSSGVFARTTALGGGKAMVNVRTKLKNDGHGSGMYTVQVALFEADGQTPKVAVQSSVMIDSGTAAELSQDVPVPSPHLWQGLEDPYLYQLVVELKHGGGNGAGNTIDKVAQDFGIRTMTFDPNLGFFLNGKSMPLRGVNMHQDYYHKAWAIDPANTDESFAVINEIGANTLRLAHYPHAQYTYDHADALGVVVWAEVPFVNIDVAHRQAAMIVAIRFEEFKRPRVIRHGHFVAKLRRPGRWCVQRFAERALETKQRAPTRHANIHDLAGGIGELVDTEVSGQRRNVFWRQRYPGFVETDWHGVCSLLDDVTIPGRSVHCTLLMIRRPFPP